MAHGVHRGVLALAALEVGRLGDDLRAVLAGALAVGVRVLDADEHRGGDLARPRCPALMALVAHDERPVAVGQRRAMALPDPDALDEPERRPEPLDGLFLVNRPKGIHKPEGWVHALSVRQALKGPYPDKPVSGSLEDGWTYDYFQEGQRPEDRDKYAGLHRAERPGVTAWIERAELRRIERGEKIRFGTSCLLAAERSD